MGKINNGKDDNFYEEIAAVTTADFLATEDVIINVKGIAGFILENYGTGIVEYSFNGNVLHGRLPAGSAAVPYVKAFHNRRVSKIWFRSLSGTNTVRVEAWGG